MASEYCPAINDSCPRLQQAIDERDANLACPSCSARGGMYVHAADCPAMLQSMGTKAKSGDVPVWMVRDGDGWYQLYRSAQPPNKRRDYDGHLHRWVWRGYLGAVRSEVVHALIGKDKHLRPARGPVRVGPLLVHLPHVAAKKGKAKG